MVAEVPMPARVAKLPVYRAYPVPWFVAWFDGVPDHRVGDTAKLIDAVKFRKCWTCGETLGKRVAFVLGPMCGVNRTSSEPPSHTDCAVFAARRCPFLSTPSMQRRERGRPEGWHEPGGVMLSRNPGVALVWITTVHHAYSGPGGYLFKFGDPIEVQWWAEGRPATRVEVLKSIDSGMPALREAAEVDGPAAHWKLDELLRRLMTLVPDAP